MCVISVYEQVIIKSDPLNLPFVNSAIDPLYDPLIKKRKTPYDYSLRCSRRECYWEKKSCRSKSLGGNRVTSCSNVS